MVQQRKNMSLLTIHTLLALCTFPSCFSKASTPTNTRKEKDELVDNPHQSTLCISKASTSTNTCYLLLPFSFSSLVHCVDEAYSDKANGRVSTVNVMHIRIRSLFFCIDHKISVIRIFPHSSKQSNCLWYISKSQSLQELCSHNVLPMISPRLSVLFCCFCQPEHNPILCFSILHKLMSFAFRDGYDFVTLS